MDFSDNYLNYKEYKKLGGTLDQTPFNILEFQAQKEIDKLTFGRLKDLDEQINEVKMCIFELINTLDSYSLDINTNENKGIASENIDGYSVTYKSTTSEDIKAKNNEIKDIIESYLSDCVLDNGIPYLYRGTK